MPGGVESPAEETDEAETERGGGGGTPGIGDVEAVGAEVDKGEGLCVALGGVVVVMVVAASDGCVCLMISLSCSGVLRDRV